MHSFSNGAKQSDTAQLHQGPRAKPVRKRPLEPKDEYSGTNDGTRYHIRHPTGFMTENSLKEDRLENTQQDTHKVLCVSVFAENSIAE